MNQVSKNLLTFPLFIAIGLLIGWGAKYAWDWYQQPPALVKTDTSAHFSNVKEPVVIYTTHWCPYCNALKTHLIQRNIPFHDRDIESGDASITALYQSIGYPGIPKIVIADKVINGFHQSILDDELEKLSY